jgi:hypothetical protein
VLSSCLGGADHWQRPAGHHPYPASVLVTVAVIDGPLVRGFDGLQFRTADNTELPVGLLPELPAARAPPVHCC